MKKKSSFTLIEMMVAFALFAIILSTFFYWTYRHTTQQKSFEKIKWPLLEERYFEERVSDLLSKTTLSPREKNEELQFYSDGKSLLFTFDNGAYTHPLLSNNIRCSLEKKGDKLVCTLRPLSNKGEAPEISYLLLDKIDSLSFSFYQPNDPTFLAIRPDDVNPNKPKVGMHSRWEESYKILPAYVRISFQREQQEKSFLFDLNYPFIFSKEVE